ncbi:MAG TPA: hypothetical protein VGR87_00555 [Candidatus Limnocylindria bacterium]|nr:hypothetical protein [Candidatus Limnocylindria bacterium]
MIRTRLRVAGAMLTIVFVACGDASLSPDRETSAPALSAEQQCTRDRALLAIAGASYAKIVAQVSAQALTVREGSYAIGQLFLNLSAVETAACAQPGWDALTLAMAARAHAYDHYAEGKTAQAAADLREEHVYLARYEAWRKAQAAETPKPTPQGATSSSAAGAWTVVQVWEGNGADVAVKRTESFTVGTEWRIDWINQSAYLGIDIYDAASGVKIPGFIWSERAGSDTTFMHRAGTYYLAIVGSGLWKVDVQDGR